MILVLVFNLVGLVAILMFLARHVYTDVAVIQDYFLCSNLEDIREDTGWKRLQREVFRPPGNGMWLSVLVGVGCQLAGSILFSLAWMALEKFRSSMIAQEGAHLEKLLMSLLCSSPLAGFVSSRLYKLWGAERWLLHLLMTALLVPCCVVGLLLTVFFLRLLE